MRLNSSKQDHAPVLANPYGIHNIIQYKFRTRKFICHINNEIKTRFKLQPDIQMFVYLYILSD